MAFRDPGTPIGSERPYKMRNTASSPLQEMDGTGIEEQNDGPVELFRDDRAFPPDPILKAIAELSSKMDSMALKTDVEGLKTDMKQFTRVAVAEAVDPVKAVMADLKAEVKDLTSRVHQIESTPRGSRAASECGSVIEAKLLELESRMEQDKHYGQTALFGGLDKFEGIEEAKIWLANKLTQLTTAKPTDIFAKGEFQGILFARFPDMKSRDEAVQKFWRARVEYGGKMTWSREDLPIERRVPESFLFGLKKVLLEWDYTKEEMHVNRDKATLSVDGTIIVKAAVTDNALVLNWDKDWESWEEFSNNAKLAALKTTAADKLTRSGAGKKAKGKGKKGRGRS